MKAFYPSTTDKIWHLGKNGNTYRLDSFDNPLRLLDVLGKYDQIDTEVVSIEGNTIPQAEALINSVHNPNISKAYKTGTPLTLAESSGVMYQPLLYDYALESAVCSKLAYHAALKDKVAYSFTGGGHHCEKDRGLGFNIINTIAIATQSALNDKNKVAIIDLDVHYSNGIFDILGGKNNVLCTGLWNKKIDKWKYFESKGSIWHRKVDDTENYFTHLNQLLELILKFKPNVVLYHMGLDVLETDRMGGIPRFTKDLLFKREKLVRDSLRDHPYAIFRGGSYINYNQEKNKIEENKAYVTDLQAKMLELHAI